MGKKKIENKAPLQHINSVDDLLTSDDITALLERTIQERANIRGLVITYLDSDDLLITKTAGVDFYQTLGILDVAKAWAIENLGHWED